MRPCLVAGLLAALCLTSATPARAQDVLRKLVDTSDVVVVAEVVACTESAPQEIGGKQYPAPPAVTLRVIRLLKRQPDTAPDALTVAHANCDDGSGERALRGFDHRGTYVLGSRVLTFLPRREGEPEAYDCTSWTHGQKLLDDVALAAHERFIALLLEAGRIADLAERRTSVAELLVAMAEEPALRRDAAADLDDRRKRDEWGWGSSVSRFLTPEHFTRLADVFCSLETIDESADRLLSVLMRTAEFPAVTAHAVALLRATSKPGFRAADLMRYVALVHDDEALLTVAQGFDSLQVADSMQRTHIALHARFLARLDELDAD